MKEQSYAADRLSLLSVGQGPTSRDVPGDPGQLFNILSKQIRAVCRKRQLSTIPQGVLQLLVLLAVGHAVSAARGLILTATALARCL